MEKDTIIIKCKQGELSLYLGQIYSINKANKTLKYRERKPYERKAKTYKLEGVKKIKKLYKRVKKYYAEINS